MINDLSSPYTALSLVGTSGGIALSPGSSDMNTTPPAGASRFDEPTPIDDTMQIGETDVYAAIWTDFAVSSGAVLKAVVDDGVGTGSAWLTLEGTDLSEATLFGAADVELDGTVKILATSGAAIGNLAAGAGSGGAVAGVQLVLDSATVTGLVYAGGLGAVGHYGDQGWGFDDVEIYVGNGSFDKDFYAGSLANHAKTGEFTGIGDVTLTVDNGIFKGNLYGASAVKVGDIPGANIHNVGNVNITVNGGEAQQVSDYFCLFGGGYATGSTGANVYTVESVTVKVTGGTWGDSYGGRGIFGGVFASGVGAAVSNNVDISISGGNMGNVHGGGWAQKNGISNVGDVNISITGGTIANVIGGGSHSTSGGSTFADDVTITVSGGTISGSIYARGHLLGDSVTGDAAVIFKGANNFSCGVYGYSYVHGGASDATLSFTDYTGTLSGGIGGFSGGITFDGTTAMTLTTAAADVSDNLAWNFDVSGRSEGLAGTALLNWTAADFSEEGTIITLNLADGDANAWSLVSATTDTVYGKFDVQVGGVDIATGLGLGDKIASGDHAGWGFTNDGGVLKFKNLA